MARFTRVFQLITVVLVVAVVNVYVMAAPIKVSTEPSKTDAPKTSDTKTENIVTEVSANTTVAPIAVAAEKLPLTPGSKINFNRIFSKSEIKARAESNHSFYNAKTSGRDIFKAPPRTGTVPQADDDKDDNSARNTWIVVGVLAAVLTIAVIGLRHDRGIESVQP
jgi:hypothetical protein